MTERDKQQKVLNVPNLLTILRLVMIPVFVWQFIVGHRIASLCLFLLASLTDMLDGYIARKYNLVTDFGKLMDPLADKLMLLTAMACLFFAGLVPLWVIVVIAAKELIMVLGGLLVLRHGLVVQAQMIGKVGTVVFVVAVALTFLHEYTAPFDLWLQYAAVALALMSVVFYVISTVREYRQRRA